MSPSTDSATPDSTGVEDPLSSRFTRPNASDLQDDGGLLSRAIARAKEGDQSAVHFLYVRYADDVQGYAQRIVRHHHDAQDVTHLAFAQLMTVIGRYEQRDGPFSAWILRVARNAALDHVRSRRQIPVEEVRTSDEGHEQVGFECSQALKEAFGRLPKDQREVLVLRHVAGLSPGEIADRLGRSE